MRHMGEAVLWAALLGAAVLFWHVRTLRAQGGVPPAAPGAPPGSGVIPLGQYAVPASKHWLLTKPGGQ